MNTNTNNMDIIKAKCECCEADNYIIPISTDSLTIEFGDAAIVLDEEEVWQLYFSLKQVLHFDEVKEVAS